MLTKHCGEHLPKLIMFRGDLHSSSLLLREIQACPDVTDDLQHAMRK
jgi:hypothetical protein